MCLHKVFTQRLGPGMQLQKPQDEKKDTNRHESSAQDTPTHGHLYLLARCVGLFVHAFMEGEQPFGGRINDAANKGTLSHSLLKPV